MIKFKIIDPTSSRPTIGEGDSLSNYGVVVPRSIFRSARNTALIDIHLRQAIQDRPYHHFMGSAEHLLLDPLANIVSSGGDPIAFMLQLAKDMNAVSKGLSLMRSKIAISTVAQVYAGLLPSTKIPGQFDRPLETKTPGLPPVPKSGLSVFSSFFSDLLVSQNARDTIFKTFKSPSPTIYPAVSLTGNPSVDAITKMFEMFEVFGMAGKRQPLFGDEITPVLARRFAVEHYLFSEPDSKLKDYAEDCRVASSIWYLMYNQIVASPEAYDAALPIVPPSPQDSQVAAQILKLLGTFTHTALSAATAPIYMDAILAVRQFSELLEFLETGPTFSDDSIQKTKAMLAACNNMITEAAYPPVVTLANSSFDYVKKLTSARYLLPEFISDMTSVTGEKPFARLTMPTAITPSASFRGSVPGSQRLVEFGGLDLPYVLENVKRRVSDLQSGLIQLSQIRTTLQSGMATQYGGTITHLDSLGSFTHDPALGTIEYPSPTRVYITPSYVPKYRTLDNLSPEWIFMDNMYSPLFPNAFQYQQLQKNMANQFFSWDTEVNLPPSPATGAEYSCLLLPYTYVSDCTSNSIANDIASVGQMLAASPHRPMAQMADFFTPLFHALSSGLNKPEVLANAVASMFSIYKKKSKSAKASAFNEPSGWELVKPQIPFIYGHPTSALLSSNAPWSSSYPCGKEHTMMSRDGQYMVVLHRALPQPSSLTYIPFTMAGGIKVSLPVNKTSYNQALTEISKTSINNPDIFFSAMSERLSSAKVENGLVKVTAWAPSYAYFPHIFVTTRNVTSSAGVVLSSVPQLMQRLSLVSDEAAPFGGVMSYFQTPVIGFDIDDEIEAVTSSDLSLDINDTLKKQSVKAVVNSDDTTPPVTQLNNENEPVQTVVPVAADIPTQTKPDGSIVAEEPPTPGSYMPVIDDKSVDPNPES